MPRADPIDSWRDPGETRGGMGIYGPTPRGKLSNQDALEYIRRRVNPKLVDAHRFPMEREWVKNIAFLNGNQHFVEVGAGFRAPILEPHKVLYRANMLRTLVTKMVATVMANSVVFKAPSKDLSKKSRDQAFVSDKLFEHLREDVLDWPGLLEDCLTWAACCGSGFIELGWDPDAGEPDRFYVDQNDKVVLIQDPDEKRLAEEQGRFYDIPPGEVMARVRSPFQVQWDWSARQDWHQANWGATKELVDIDELEHIYGFEKTRDVKPIEPKSHSMWYDEMLGFMGGLGGLGSTPSYITPKDKARQRVVLVRYFERPMRHNNFKGRFIAAAGDAVLENSANPFAKTKFPIPFVKLDWQRRPGSFMGHPVVEDLRNPQFQYNNGRARQTEVLNCHSTPTTFIDKRSGIPENMLSIAPGTTLHVDVAACGGKPVAFGPVPAVPKELSESVTRSLSEMNLIASQADPDMSALPGQIRGAPALNMMVQEKNKSLLPAARSALKCTLQGGRIMLAIAKSNYTSRRTLKYVGEDNAYRILSFEAADIQTDIRVVGEPEYFQTKANAKAEIQDYVQAGILDPINNPEDRITVLKVLAFGNAEEALSERLADEENQERELDEMAADPTKYIVQSPLTGKPMLNYPTNPADDDAVHARVMRRRMKSQEFRELDPVAKQLWVQHLQEHVQKLQQQMMQQMAMAQAQQGRPGQTGQPSKPKPGSSGGQQGQSQSPRPRQSSAANSGAR